MKILSVFFMHRDPSQLSHSVKEFFKLLLDPEPDVDEFQNLIISFLSKDTIW